MSTRPDIAADDAGSLDPADWDAFEASLVAEARRVVADLRNLRQGPVWRPVPDELKARLSAPPPWAGTALGPLADEVAAFMAYGVGNRHPRFFGWVHGAGTPAGVVADLFASALNANCGGRDHVATYVERQVVAWFRDVFGLPERAGGLLVSGTSMATLVALAAAREAATDGRARREGLAQGPRLTVYASAEAHASVSKAVELLD
ncbi:MAG: pyridoxal-dependent decarboxylase, partial [Alphaproteobacteria bacterium]